MAHSVGWFACIKVWAHCAHFMMRPILAHISDITMVSEFIGNKLTERLFSETTTFKWYTSTWTIVFFFFDRCSYTTNYMTVEQATGRNWICVWVFASGATTEQYSLAYTLKHALPYNRTPIHSIRFACSEFGVSACKYRPIAPTIARLMYLLFFWSPLHFKWSLDVCRSKWWMSTNSVHACVCVRDKLAWVWGAAIVCEHKIQIAM